jgi:hypothetical protein
MVRGIFNFAAALSFLLCVGASVLVLRNRSSVELLAVAHGHWAGNSPLYQAGAVSLGAGDGRISVCYSRWGFNFSHVNELNPDFAGPSNPMQYRLRNPRELTFVHQQHAINDECAPCADWHGFACDAISERSNAEWVNSCGLTLPAWLLLLLTALLPARWMVRAAPHLRHPRQSIARLCVAIVDLAIDPAARPDSLASSRR